MTVDEQVLVPARRRAFSGTRRVVVLLAAAAVAVVVGAVAVPTALPGLGAAVSRNPSALLLVALCWTVATTAAIAGKRTIAAGYLNWADTATAHVGGTVANRVVPAGAGAAGVFIAALHRRGASTTVAAGVVALWAVAGGLAHVTGLLLGVAWLRQGVHGLLMVVVAAVTVAVGSRLLAIWLAGRRAARLPVPQLPAAGPSPCADGFLSGDVTSGDVTSGDALSASGDAPSASGGAGRAARTRGRMRTRLRRLLDIGRDLLAVVRARPLVALVAVAAQLAAALCLATGFALAAVGFGVPVSVGAAVAAYLAGTALSAATPTPGGIGSAETALVGTLMLAGAGIGEALPAVLLFRAVVLVAPLVAAAALAMAWVAARLLAAIRAQRPAAAVVVLAIEPAAGTDAATP